MRLFADIRRPTGSFRLPVRPSLHFGLQRAISNASGYLAYALGHLPLGSRPLSNEMMDSTECNVDMAFLCQDPGDFPVGPAASEQLVDQAAVWFKSRTARLCRQAVQDFLKIIHSNL